MPENHCWGDTFLICYKDAKGRIWFGLFAGVRKSSFCAQMVVLLFALVCGLVLSIVGFAVSFAGMRRLAFVSKYLINPFSIHLGFIIH